MTTIFRSLRTLLGLLLMLWVATIPACGSMGGGTKYLIDPLFERPSVADA